MKELTIEEKAAHYDLAIKKAKSKIKIDKDHVLYEDDVIEIFPELKKSEDERIRKAILEHIQLCTESIPNRDKFIAWLEKQGEQKPANKVEPKFRKGDWIIFNGLTLYVKEVVKGFYRTISIGGIYNSYDWDIDKIARLWTIQDAKDGDVLYINNVMSESIMIYKSFNTGIINKYASYNKFGFEGDNYLTLNDGYIQPATKEQRDTLMEAMSDAGYTFDFEKKELKKL